MRLAVVAPLVAPVVPRQSRGNHSVLVDLAVGLARRGHEVVVHAAAGSELPAVRGLQLAPVRVDPASSGRYAIVPEADADARDGVVVAAAERDRLAAADPALPFAEAFDSVADAIGRSGADAVSNHAFDVEAVRALERLACAHTLHLPPIVPAVVDAVRGTSGPLVAVSAAMAATWRTTLGRAVVTVPNGIPDPWGGARWVPPSHVESIAVIAGRISPEKGTADAIRLARAAGLAPIVVGEVYDQRYYDEEVQSLLARRPSPIDRAALARLLRDAAVLLLPVRWDEPFGLVAAEAQMAGCPVVAYARGGLPEVVADGIGGCLVTPGDEHAFVRAVGAVGRLDRRAIRASAVSRLSLEGMVDAYERLLEAVAARSAVDRRPGRPSPPARSAAVDPVELTGPPSGR